MDPYITDQTLAQGVLALMSIQCKVNNAYNYKEKV
jgi:hypothetical protein